MPFYFLGGFCQAGLVVSCSARSLGAVKNNTKRITEPRATRANAINNIVFINTP